MPASNGSKLFQDVETLHPGRSGFDLSSEHKTTFDIGQLIPIFTEDCVPGDKMRLGVQAVLRFQPLVAPIMHRIDAYVHFWFVPYRLLWAGAATGDGEGTTPNWEIFITGGPDGTDTSKPPPMNLGGTADTAKGTLWDYFGHPIGFYTTWTGGGANPDMVPRMWQWRAYNMVFNENYRDENLQPTPLDLDNNTVQYRAWEKDYFTSALPWQQRGTAPSFPVSGLTSAIFDDALIPLRVETPGIPSQMDIAVATFPGAGFPFNLSSTVSATGGSPSEAVGVIKTDLDQNTVDLSSATTFTLADFRTVAAIEQWQERNARGGVRLTEWTLTHFGIKSEDYRLQRPEYIGGQRWPIITSEVLNTSGTGTEGSESPQGNMAGHGLGFTNDFSGSYAAKEYGIIIGLISCLARPTYQNGIRRNWKKIDKFAYYQPEFAHMSEQAIETSELYAIGDETIDSDTFGWQGQYDEYRYKPSMVTNEMRDTFDYWHLGRKFTTQPLLNSSFISSADTTKRIFAVQDVPGILADVGIRCEAIRPMPYRAIPGLMRI